MEITGWFLMVYLFSATDISSLSDRLARIIKFFHTHIMHTHTHMWKTIIATIIARMLKNFDNCTIM